MAAGVETTTGSGTVVIDKWADNVSKAQAAAKAEKATGGSATPTSPASKGGSPPQKNVEKLTKVALISATTWDVFAPPPSNSFKVRLSCPTAKDRAVVILPLSSPYCSLSHSVALCFTKY
jgi:hypothetical protein